MRVFPLRCRFTYGQLSCVPKFNHYYPISEQYNYEDKSNRFTNVLRAN
jgi:hypothetical protein